MRMRAEDSLINFNARSNRKKKKTNKNEKKFLTNILFVIWFIVSSCSVFLFSLCSISYEFSS